MHFKAWDAPVDPCNCTSYLEGTMESNTAKHPSRWVELNKRMFSRIYPAGLRVDSSNYEPTPAWTAGCQLVAINYQTPGLPKQIYQGEERRDTGGLPRSAGGGPLLLIHVPFKSDPLCRALSTLSHLARQVLRERQHGLPPQAAGPA